jgi:hypothetical protein
MVLNYKDSIKSEMSLSAMLGKNVNLSEVRAKFMSGDQEGAMESLKAQGLDPAKMDMFQQQMLQQATGMDLNTLSKLNTNTGKSVNLGAGDAKAGNQSFLGRTEAAARTEAVKNAMITVEEGKFNIKMDAAEELAISQNKQVQAIQKQIEQTEALRDAETGLTTALFGILSGLATSEIGGFLKELKNNPFGKNDFKKNAAGRNIDKKTGRFVSAETMAKGRTGMSMGTKLGGSVLAAGAGAIQGYQNFDKVREGETEVRTTDKMGAGLVQGGLAAGGAALGAVFGGPIGMAIGGFIGDSLGGALNEYAPGIAQGVGDVFGGMSKAWDTLKGKLTAVWDSLQPLRDAFTSVAKALGFEEGGFSGVLSMIGEFVGNVLITPFMLLADAFAFVGNLIGGFIQILTGDFSGGFDTIKAAFGNFFSGIWDTITNLFGGLWNWLADSKVGKFLGLGKVEIKKTEAAKPTAQPAKTTPTAQPAKTTPTASTTTTKGVDTKMVGDNYKGKVELGEAGTKSITAAITGNSKWMQDKVTYMSGNLEKVVDRTDKTANNTAASLEQIKVLNTNTLAMKELTRKIEALTRAQYEGGTTVRIDGKVLATAATKYQDNTTGMTGITPTKTTYG